MKRRIMGRDSGIAEVVFVLILLALGGAIIRKVRKDPASYRHFLDSDLVRPEKIPALPDPKVQVLPLNSQVAQRKKQNKAIDVRKVVRPSPLPYHLEKGWQKNARVYQGYYRCRLGAFRGQIEKRFNGDYKFYIFDPPEAVLTGSHKACFTNVGAGRYHVHFGVNSGDLDSGIMAVERLLYQSLKRR